MAHIGVRSCPLHIVVGVVHIVRLVGGKIVKHRPFSDHVGMLRQLGIIPTAVQTER